MTFELSWAVVWGDGWQEWKLETKQEWAAVVQAGANGGRDQGRIGEDIHRALQEELAGCACGR